MRWLTFNYRPEYRYGILAGLRQVGEEVLVAPLRSQGERQAQKMTRIIEAYRPDIVFHAGWAHDVVDPAILFEVLEGYGLPHVYWATEDPTFHREVSFQFAPHSQLVLTTTEELLFNYQRIPVPTALMLFGCNPDFHRPGPVDPWLYRQVVLVANNYLAFGHHHPARLETTERMLLPLLDAGVDVNIWGLWWDDEQSPVQVPKSHWSGPLNYRHLPRVYSAADMVLGLQFEVSSRTQTSCRPFEVLACGAFHLAPYTEATAALFTDGEHLVLSHSAQETLELTLYYLKNPQERKAIAQRGRQYVIEHHNYQERAGQLLRLVSAHGLV